MPHLKALFLRLAAVWGTLAVSGTALADWDMNLVRGVTPLTKDMYDLHMLILYIVTAIGVIVFGIIAWSVIFHRKSRGVKPATFHESHTIELIWTIIPFVILVAMAVPATKVLIKMEQTGDADITLKVTGYQWMWRYDYLDSGVSFYSKLDAASNEARQLDSGIDPTTVPNYIRNVDREVVLPVGKKIRILTTASDVIHAWWVPELGGKKDAIPGFVNEWWMIIEKPGIYRGQCAELCGRDHAFMPVVVRAVPEQEYLAWVDEQKDSQLAASTK